MSSNIKTVGVISTGVIGSSWIALFLARGLHVLVSDPAPDAEEKLVEHLESIWPSLKDNLSPGASVSNYQFVGKSLDGYYDQVDFIQENAPERLDLKARILAEADAATRPGVIIASSSSGIPSSQFIMGCKNKPGRILIGHPFNPPHLIPLVEVVPHPQTDPEVADRALAFYRSLGKRPILLKKEVPGFIANRLQAAIVLEAYSLVSRGIVSAGELDECVTEGLGLRWALAGPFMTNVLGGGGPSGFAHLLAHLMPSVQKWNDDMKANAFQFKDEEIKVLENSVQQMLQHQDFNSFQKQFSHQFGELITIKSSDS